jgi:hypothetical protein
MFPWILGVLKGGVMAGLWIVLAAGFAVASFFSVEMVTRVVAVLGAMAGSVMFGISLRDLFKH